jgi:signal transduction histidine kinase/ActR/RegA family two-component response regulator
MISVFPGRQALAATVLVTLFATGVILAGWYLYQRDIASDEAAAMKNVASVTELKVSKIATWREERLHDAQYLTVDPSFAEQIAQVSLSGVSPVAPLLKQRVKILFRNPEYLNAVLLNPGGDGPLIPGTPIPDRNCLLLLAQARRSGKPVFGEIERRATDGVLHIDVVAPLLGRDRRIEAFLVTQIDPSRFLYPALNSWPGVSSTGETLLVRRDGDTVLFLNDVQHRRGTALQYRLPLTAGTPSTLAAEGRAEDLRGWDYRNREVLASIRPVPGTAWAVVSKVDVAEALAETRQQTRLLIAALVALVALAGASVGLVLFSLRSRFYRRQYAETVAREILLKQHASALAEAEARVRESAERLRLAVSGTSTALYIQDVKLRYTWVYNPSGLTREAMVGRTDEELFGSSGRSLAALKRTVLASRVPMRREVELRFLDTRHYYDLTIEPIVVEDDVVGVRGVANDVTERHLLEDQLRQAQKLEAVGQLAGGVAHDFNNLLTAINGYTELALSETTPEDTRRRDLVEVLRAGERAAALTRQLLAFSRKQVLQPEPVDVNQLISHTSWMLRRIIGEDIRLDLSLCTEAWVYADRGQLGQVLLNLCVNSRDAMAGGGRITVGTSQVASDGNSRVRIIVSDTGSGIPADILPHIFEPFFTTKDRGKGTGLGLATVYGVVQQSGGTIDVNSRVGEGTTFTIEFPTYVGDSAPIVASLQSECQGTERILIVEDDPPVRMLAEQVLVRAGYHVASAGTVDDALALAHGESFDLLLTDVVMPEMDGCQLAERIQALHAGTRVLFMSGYAATVLTDRGMISGAPPLLQKPFSALGLTNAVREALDASPTEP